MPAFSLLEFLTSIPAFVVTCPDDVIAGAFVLALILLVRRVGTSEDGGAGRMFW